MKYLLIAIMFIEGYILIPENKSAVAESLDERYVFAGGEIVMLTTSVGMKPEVREKIISCMRGCAGDDMVSCHENNQKLIELENRLKNVEAILDILAKDKIEKLHRK